MLTAITAATLFTPDEVITSPLVIIEDGKILSIASGSAAEVPATAQHIHYHGATLAPAFFDVHLHGAAGHDVMEATPDALNSVGNFLATRGVGHYLPTTVTAPIEKILFSLDGIANAIESQSTTGARPIGIHLEGPFISHIKRGVHPPDLILNPSVELFDRFYQAARGHIKLLTIAPEVPGAIETIAHAVSLGVRISLGHSNATLAEAQAGAAAGAHSFTHTYNAMRPLDHREPGILGLALTGPLYADLICDGVHVAPEAVEIFWKSKGPDRAILITDGISATGMPEGTYMLGNLIVQVADGMALADGTLAGSVLTLDRAVKNFAAFTGATPAQTYRLAAANPARMMGLDDRIGTLAPGRPADISVIDKNGNIIETLISGAASPN
jgi:N-acetylglucosamine-6-phosphate deacetylase